MAENPIKLLLETLSNDEVTRQYNLGLLSDKDVKSLISYDKGHKGSLTLYGRTIRDYYMEMSLCDHNPSVIKYFKNAIATWNQKSEKSEEQNKLNLDRLEYLEYNACGVGLRKVLKIMKNLARKCHHNLDLKITYLLMCIEYANLKAKQHIGEMREVIYERKEYLLEKIAPLLEKAGYKCGLSFNPGKNAAYVIYCYLPNGQQLSWHTTWRMYDVYPEIDVKWDGQKASTMLKLVDYVQDNKYINF